MSVDISRDTFKLIFDSDIVYNVSQTFIHNYLIIFHIFSCLFSNSHFFVTRKILKMRKKNRSKLAKASQARHCASSVLKSLKENGGKKTSE